MFKISGQTKLAALYAQPARHSFSPLMQTTAFQAAGIDAIYLSFDLTAEKFPHAMEAIRSLDLLGVNISMPYKQKALTLVDEVDQAAQLIGAVNTVVNQKGKLIGYNTDGAGFMKSMAEQAVESPGKELTLLGAGGAAQAILVQAALDGVRKINVFNRPSPNYQKIAALIERLEQVTTCEFQLFELAEQTKLAEKIAGSTLLVNATSVGMTTSDSLVPPEMLRRDLVVADLIYQPQQTALLQAAKANGAQTINGLGMLLHQGAEAFKLWTGQSMPLAVVRPVLEKQIKMKE